MTKRGRRLSHDDFRHGCACSLEGYDAALELAKPLLEQLDVVHGVAEGVFLEGSTHLFLQPVDALLTRLADIADLDAGNVVDKTLDGVETGKPSRSSGWYVRISSMALLWRSTQNAGSTCWLLARLYRRCVSHLSFNSRSSWGNDAELVVLTCDLSSHT